MRSNLKELQPDPIDVERLLQMRATPEDDRRESPPTDETLEAAVARMTEAAEADGRTGLVMAPEEWSELVNQHLGSTDVFSFTQEVINRLGEVEDTDRMNRWLALATNVWNNAPQRDRGGRSANQLSR